MGNGFFEAECPFGGLTGWTPQSGANTSRNFSQAVMLGKTGDFHASADYDPKETVSCTYKANEAGADIPAAGQVLNGWHIDSVEVSWSQTDFVSMTVSGHKHLAGKGDKNCRTYKGSIAKAGGFGCPASLGPFSVGENPVGVRSYSYSVTCNHEDVLAGDGNHFASDNYDGMETLSIELTGEIEFQAKDGWHLDTDGRTPSNTTATSMSATYSKHILGTAPTGTASGE